MKPMFILIRRWAAGLVLPALLLTGAAQAQNNVSVSIGVNQPGLYGRIDIGNAPPPMVVYPEPVIYAPSHITVHQRPIYLYVPADHQRHWGRYCGRYAACGQPVYFVQERWVRDRWEHQHKEHRHKHKHKDKDKDKDKRERSHEGRGRD